MMMNEDDDAVQGGDAASRREEHILQVVKMIVSRNQGKENEGEALDKEEKLMVMGQLRVKA